MSAPAAYFLVFGSLALCSLLADKKERPLIIGLFAVIGALLAVASFFDSRLRVSRQLRAYDQAISAGTVEELSVRAVRMWELQERDDEGACYAFELASGCVVFIAGQDFEPSARFPNTDFSVVEIKDQDDGLLGMLIEKRGLKIAPERLLSGQELKGVKIPLSGSTFKGSLARLSDQNPLISNWMGISS